MKLIQLLTCLALLLNIQVHAQVVLSQFTSTIGHAVLNGTLIPPFYAKNAQTCATSCLSYKECVSFNYCSHGSNSSYCGLNKYLNTYTVVQNDNCTTYLRNITRNDIPIKPAVQYNLQVPTKGITLKYGILKTVFDTNLIYLSQFPLDDLLYFYRIRGGDATPPGKCWGWDQNLKGSISGLYMMGAANALRWTTNTTLHTKLDLLIEGIAKYQDSDGFIMAYTKNETKVSENPNYVLSWVTHGLIDSFLQGNQQALKLARDQITWYNYNPYIPEYLPPYDDQAYKPQCSLSGCGDHEGHG